MDRYLENLKEEANVTFTQNGAKTYKSTLSDCLDLFATIGALRNSTDEEIIKRFSRAYAENADIAMKTLFFARDIRGGLGERRVFKTIFSWLSVNEPSSVKKNLMYVAEYGRFDDLLSLMDTPCEKELIDYISSSLKADMANLAMGNNVSLLAKWLPSVNASNKDTVRLAKKIARGLGLSDKEYRKVLSSLRANIKIIENNLREKDYTFKYEKQPSLALLKYRKAFIRNDSDRYTEFIREAANNSSVLHTATLTPNNIVAPIIKSAYVGYDISEEERLAFDTTWNALGNYTSCENALAVVDGSGSMYCGFNASSPISVAMSLGIYFAEKNTGAFKNHFITFSQEPALVEVKGRDITEKVKYCMGFNEVANTNLQKTFDLLLKTAVSNDYSQSDMPSRLYIISDMEFDYCVDEADVTNFEYAKGMFERFGYKLPEIVFWNVNSHSNQQPVSMNEKGVVLVSGCSHQIFSMLKEGEIDPYSFMMSVLSNDRYERIVA